MKQHKDQRYLIALRNKDPHLIRELYTKFSPQVINWVRNNSGTTEDAKDVFQEALIALYHKACDPDFQLNYSIGGLIFRICKNKWIDHLRGKDKMERVRILEIERHKEEASSVPVIAQIEEEEIRQRKLDAAFQQLSKLCQQLLRLVFQGLESEEIVVQLGMTNTNTYYRRKSACVDRWKVLYRA